MTRSRKRAEFYLETYKPHGPIIDWAPIREVGDEWPIYKDSEGREWLLTPRGWHRSRTIPWWVLVMVSTIILCAALLRWLQ